MSSLFRDPLKGHNRMLLLFMALGYDPEEIDQMIARERALGNEVDAIYIPQRYFRNGMPLIFADVMSPVLRIKGKNQNG